MSAFAVIAVLAAIAFLATPARADVTNNFETGGDGWTVNRLAGSTPAPHATAGGNPGGHVAWANDGDNSVQSFVAPGLISGDRRTSVGRRLIFDLRVEAVDPAFASFPLVQIYTSGGENLRYTTDANPSAAWQHFDIPLQPGTGWTVGNGSEPGVAATSADFERVFAAITSGTIRAEFHRTTGTTGLDNVVFQAPTVDLSASVTGPERVVLNEAFGTTVTVTNAGPDIAQAVGLAIQVPDNAPRPRITSPNGSCSGGGPVFTCMIGDMAPGTTRTFRIDVALVNAPGSEAFTATVTSPTLDVNGADNRAVQRVTAIRGGPPPPVTGKTVNLSLVSGVVQIKRPGDNAFTRLRADEQIPVGSTVDTRRGKVALTSTAARRGVQTALFYEGQFVVTQTRGKKPVTEMRLNEALARCDSARAAGSRRRPRTRRLWGDGNGSFRTKGSYSAASVRGTKWLVTDTCTTTTTRVGKGVVAVEDFARKKTITLRAGGRYVARRVRK